MSANISLSVTDYLDLGTHGMFICEITESKVISKMESITYAYYHKYVKPKPEAKAAKASKGYVCTVCGYVHDEDEIPDDFECPLCKHGRDAFVPIEDN